MQGDVTDLPALQKAIAQHHKSATSFTSPACKCRPAGPIPILGAQVNVIGTLAVFEAVRMAGEQIKRLVYASSSAVFGPPEKYPKGPLPDDVKLLPSTHYGYFKVLQRRQRRRSISRTSAFPALACGPGRSTASAATSA